MTDQNLTIIEMQIKEVDFDLHMPASLLVLHVDDNQMFSYKEETDTKLQKLNASYNQLNQEPTSSAVSINLIESTIKSCSIHPKTVESLK